MMKRLDAVDRDTIRSHTYLREDANQGNTTRVGRESRCEEWDTW